MSLQHHDVKVHIKFRPWTDCVSAIKKTAASVSDKSFTPALLENKFDEYPSMSDVRLVCEYVYLDKKERKWFAQNTHTYLIEQIQENVFQQKGNVGNYELNFNHPCKELIWFVRNTMTDKKRVNDWLNFGRAKNEDIINWGGRISDRDTEPFTTIRLLINGQERTEKKRASYYRHVVPYKRHSRTPSNYIYCYSFCLHPENSQPSGTMDFSIANTVQLIAEYESNYNDEEMSGEMHVFAVNYNQLVITEGMAGLAFSN